MMTSFRLAVSLLSYVVISSSLCFSAMAQTVFTIYSNTDMSSGSTLISSPAGNTFAADTQLNAEEVCRSYTNCAGFMWHAESKIASVFSSIGVQRYSEGWTAGVVTTRASETAASVTGNYGNYTKYPSAAQNYDVVTLKVPLPYDQCAFACDTSSGCMGYLAAYGSGDSCQFLMGNPSGIRVTDKRYDLFVRNNGPAVPAFTYYQEPKIFRDADRRQGTTLQTQEQCSQLCSEIGFCDAFFFTTNVLDQTTKTYTGKPYCEILGGLRMSINGTYQYGSTWIKGVMKNIPSYANYAIAYTYTRETGYKRKALSSGKSIEGTVIECGSACSKLNECVGFWIDNKAVTQACTIFTGFDPAEITADTSIETWIKNVGVDAVTVSYVPPESPGDIGSTWTHTRRDSYTV